MAKGLGIFFVALGYAKGFAFVRLWIYGFHMPLFFILAGYMFDWEIWKKRGIRALAQSCMRAYLMLLKMVGLI